MSLVRIASRYAKSLIDLARDQNKLDRIHHDMTQVVIACQNRDFLLLCKSPIIPTSKKASVHKILFENIMDPMSFGFFNILLKKGREAYMPEIAAEYIKQYEAINKKTKVKLTTAEKLDPGIITDIQNKLTKASSTRDNIELESKIKPDIIGGFILEFDDKLYDASVSNQLRIMRKALTNQSN